MLMQRKFKMDLTLLHLKKYSITAYTEVAS